MTKTRIALKAMFAVSFVFFAYCCFILPEAGAMLSLIGATTSFAAAVLG